MRAGQLPQARAHSGGLGYCRPQYRRGSGDNQEQSVDERGSRQIKKPLQAVRTSGGRNPRPAPRAAHAPRGVQARAGTEAAPRAHSLPYLRARLQKNADGSGQRGNAGDKKEFQVAEKERYLKVGKGLRRARRERAASNRRQRGVLQRARQPQAHARQELQYGCARL